MRQNATQEEQVQFIDASHCQNLKSRWFFMECGWIYHFLISLTLPVLQRQKAYRILAVLPFKMSAPWLPWDSPWSLVSTPWAMSWCFKFRAIYFWLLNEYWWWDQAKIYHIIRQLSHRFMCEIMIWSDDKTKLIHKNIFTRLRLQAFKP